MMVTNRTPSATSEEFTLLSYASRLKRKIPQKVESINSVHIVQAGARPRRSSSRPLCLVPRRRQRVRRQGYYMRVRTTAAPNTPAWIRRDDPGQHVDRSARLRAGVDRGARRRRRHRGAQRDLQTQPVSWSTRILPTSGIRILAARHSSGADRNRLAAARREAASSNRHRARRRCHAGKAEDHDR
jgi:hypothetical protein